VTTAADGFAGHDRAGMARWSGSLVIVLLLHVAAGLYLASRHVMFDSAGPQQPTVMIDLAPLPVPAPPASAPPEPVVQPQTKPQVEPEPPPPPPVELPKPEPTPAPRPAVALPVKPPPKPKPRPVEHPPAEAQPLPLPAAPPIAAPPAPPAAAPPAANASAVRASWQTLVAAQLERNKRYPRLAQEQRQEGVVTLRFAIDRQGRVLSVQIDKASGFSLLDEEVLALVQRAQPLPTPPPEIPGARIELVVPVRFSIDRTRR
jgi:protein TonB